MVATLVRQRIEEREESLSPYAARSSQSRGRERPEEPSPLRSEFQRDRDRIIHSKSFRRLKHKTQVFIAPAGDHYVTRLTHTLEVAQIARTIARALNLNEDLTEAIALGHDIGHTPFGHVGEDELNSLDPDGFRHAEQSLRLVEKLEKEGQGLNLTWEVRHGIVSHSKPRGDFLGAPTADGLSLEGQVCRLADAVAYLNHDLADAFRAGLLDPESVPRTVTGVLGKRHSQRINSMVNDVVESSWPVAGLDGRDGTSRPTIAMSSGVRDAMNALREFMFEEVYVPTDRGEEGQTGRRIMRLLYGHFQDQPEEVPVEYKDHGKPVADHVAGMTDLYALRVAERVEPGIAKSLSRALV